MTKQDNSVPDFIPYDENEVLLGYQKRWIADSSRLKIAEKSRRTGLTWAEAADNALMASLKKSEGGTDTLYVGSDKEMTEEYINAVAMWAKMFNYAASEIEEKEEVFKTPDGDKEILTFTIYFASGFKVKALSSNPKNLRGRQGIVVIDEAAFHERLAEVVKSASALTMWGAKVRIISTHNGSENLFNELIVDSRAGKKKYSVHSLTLDEACKECHSNYEKNPRISKIGLKMHEHYVSLLGSKKQIKCVGCHVSTGHKGLLNTLNYYKPANEFYKGKFDKEKQEREKALDAELSRKVR